MLSLLLNLPGQTFAWAQSNESLAQSLSALEQACGLSSGSGTGQGSSIISRLESLEQKVWGQAQTGNVLERVGKLQSHLANQPTQSTSPSGQDNYLDLVLAGTQAKVMRFKEMPIAVLIESYPDSSFVQACIAGFESWEIASNGLVRFSQTDNGDLARIRVVWRHLGIARDGSNCALGAHTVTKWQKNPGSQMRIYSFNAVPIPIVIPHLGAKYTVPPQIIEVNLDLIMARPPEVRQKLVQNIVTHELGHALGLLAHSPNKSDMMYSVTDENSQLSQRDINTIKKLYETKKVDVAL